MRCDCADEFVNALYSCSRIRFLIIFFLTTLFVHSLQPRESMRAGEVNTVKRLETAFADLKCQNILGLGKSKVADNVLGPRRGGLPV